MSSLGYFGQESPQVVRLRLVPSLFLGVDVDLRSTTFTTHLKGRVGSVSHIAPEVLTSVPAVSQEH